jgi:hypothetical protein
VGFGQDLPTEVGRPLIWRAALSLHNSNEPQMHADKRRLNAQLDLFLRIERFSRCIDEPGINICVHPRLSAVQHSL